MRMRYLILLVLIGLLACQPKGNSNETIHDDSLEFSDQLNPIMDVMVNDPYEMMHHAFIGTPEIEDFKPMLDDVMERYKMPITDENALKVGNMLVALRKDSKVGVTEMDILKHIYQKGSANISLAEQAGISAAELETTK
jgi:hypothetical protein